MPSKEKSIKTILKKNGFFKNEALDRLKGGDHKTVHPHVK